MSASPLSSRCPVRTRRSGAACQTLSGHLGLAGAGGVSVCVCGCACVLVGVEVGIRATLGMFVTITPIKKHII